MFELLLFVDVEFQTEVFEDVTRDVVLDQQHVRHFVIVMLSPKLCDVL